MGIKEKKTESILIKATPSEHEAIKRAARALGMSKSEFMLTTASKSVAKVFAGDAFRLLAKSADGSWVFKGRRLRVFTFYYMFSSQDEFSAEEFSDMYHLSMAHFKEAKQLCEHVEPDGYAKRVKEFEEEDKRLANESPY